MERDKTIFLFNELIGNIKNTTREVCYYFFDSNDWQIFTFSLKYM